MLGYGKAKTAVQEKVVTPVKNAVVISVAAIVFAIVALFVSLSAIGSY